VQYGGQNIRELYTLLSSLGVVFLMCIFGNCICLESKLSSYVYLSYLMFTRWKRMCICCTLMCICCISCVFVVPLMCICCTVCTAVLTLDAGLLARSLYPEGPTTGHLVTGFSWFPCVYKRMLRWFPSFQVATTCLSCSPPDLNSLVTFFSYLCTCKITTATG
jgi:hypothetical protein